MLRKDNINITKGLAEKFKEELKAIGVGKKEVVFKLVNSVYNENKKPRSYSIESNYLSRDLNGDTSSYQYYKSENKKNLGGFIQETFTPEFLAFTSRGDITINIGEDKKDNLDMLIFFLMHPRRAKSKTGDGLKKALFYLEDKNMEAIEQAAFKTASAKMTKYLFDDSLMLSEDKLRTIATALRVVGVEHMNLARVQISIEDKCKKNPHLFLGMTEIGDEVNMRANLQIAIEKNFINFNQIKKKWFLNDTDSGDGSPLAPVKGAEPEVDALVYWIKNIDDRDHYGKIVELITGKPVERKAVESNGDSAKDLLALKKEENESLRLQIELKNAGGDVRTQSEDTTGKDDSENVDFKDLGMEDLVGYALKNNIKHHPQIGEEKLRDKIKLSLETA